jgi:hypothetical protein
MIDRKLTGLCALALASCPAAFAQQTQQGQPGVFQVAPVPAARVPSTIDADGRTLLLRVVEETDDPERPYHYVSAQIRNVPDGYARFAITGDFIVGTIVTPAATYRVLPATDGRPFALHLLARSNDPAARFRLISEPWARGQELRHVQMERLAYIRPQQVWLNDAGQYFSAKGGNFGKLTGFDAASVAAALRNIAELTWAPDPLDLKIVRVAPVLPAGTLVEFSQKIRGIPLSRTDRLTTDARGTIVELTTQFVDPAWASKRRLIAAQEGLDAALAQIAIETGSPVTRYELINPTTLFYSVEGRTLVPYYTFNIAPQPSGRPAAVRVNAHSKEARLLVDPQL